MKTQGLCLLPHRLQQRTVPTAVEPDTEAPLFQKRQSLQNAAVIFLGEEPADMENFYGIVQGIFALFLTAAQVDAVGDHGNFGAFQTVYLGDGLLNFPGQGHGDGLLGKKQVLCDLLVQEDRLLGGLIVDGMDNGHLGRGQGGILEGMQVGVDDLRLGFGNDLFQPPYKSQVQP